MVDMDLFAKRLRLARLVAGLSQQKAADMAGVSRIVVAKAEVGMTTPCTYTVVSLANVYNVSLDWLFGRKSRRESHAESSGVLQAPAASTEECRNDHDGSCVRTVHRPGDGESVRNWGNHPTGRPCH